MDTSTLIWSLILIVGGVLLLYLADYYDAFASWKDFWQWGTVGLTLNGIFAIIYGIIILIRYLMV
jgi:hypothetical protein